MTVEGKSSPEVKQPDPRLIELISSGQLIPLYRTYGFSELNPQINVVVAHDADPKSTDALRELKIFSVPLLEINIAQDYLERQQIDEAAKDIVDRFFRGLRATPTTRYLDSHR